MNVQGSSQQKEVAYFAGGCFWCMEPPFEKLEGVTSVISGYCGGEKENPTYQEVASGQTAHREAIKITYNPNFISYDQLLNIFWQNVDPTDSQGQFVDRGRQYSTAIFYASKKQQELALKSLDHLKKESPFSKEIVTPILPFKSFFPAEEYHQDYYKKNPIRYKFYRSQSGRDHFLDEVWHKEKRKK